MDCNKIKFLKITFYAIFVGLSVPYYIRITKGLYNNFIVTNIVFNLDTLFLNWNTSFPAVTVCEIYNGEKIWDLSEKYFGPEHDMNLDDVVGEIAFFRGTCMSCNKCEYQNLTCPLNFISILQTFRSNCSSLIINCKYQNEIFDCCHGFRPINTELGICFAFNSIQASKSYDVEYSSNRELGVGFLNFEITADIQLHIHSPIEIPNLSSEDMIKETILLGTNKEIIVSTMEVFNHPNLYKINYDERKCRFPQELTDMGKELKLYDYYSFSTCMVECVLANQLKHCNCSNHFLFKQDSPFNMCSYDGLICLMDYYYDIVEDLNLCDCMGSCDEPEYNIIYNSADDNIFNTTKIKVAVADQPTTRYVRRINKTNLDLLLSIGGLAGLFFNASFTSIVELLFLMLFYNWKSLINV